MFAQWKKGEMQGVPLIDNAAKWRTELVRLKIAPSLYTGCLIYGNCKGRDEPISPTSPRLVNRAALNSGPSLY